MSETPRTCPSDYLLDEYWLARQPSDHPVAAHLTECALCRGRLAEWHSADEAFASFLPESLAAVRRRVPPRRTPLFAWRWVWAGAASMALAASLLLVVSTSPDEPPTLALKGALGMQVYCQRNGRIFQVQSGETLFAEDMLRFVPTAELPGYVMVVAVDASGHVHPYAPAEATRAAPFNNGEPLPGSVILDPSTGDEQIFMLFRPRPFDLDEVRAAVQRSWHGSPASLTDLPFDGDQLSILVHKEAR